MKHTITTLLSIIICQTLHSAQPPATQQQPQTVKSILEGNPQPQEPILFLTQSEKVEYCDLYQCICTDSQPLAALFKQMYPTQDHYLKFKDMEKKALLLRQAAQNASTENPHKTGHK